MTTDDATTPLQSKTIVDYAREYRSILGGVNSYMPVHSIILGTALMLCTKMICDQLDKKRRESE